MREAGKPRSLHESRVLSELDRRDSDQEVKKRKLSKLKVKSQSPNMMIERATFLKTFLCRFRSVKTDCKFLCDGGR